MKKGRDISHGPHFKDAEGQSRPKFVHRHLNAGVYSRGAERHPTSQESDDAFCVQVRTSSHAKSSHPLHQFSRNFSCASELSQPDGRQLRLTSCSRSDPVLGQLDGRFASLGVGLPFFLKINNHRFCSSISFVSQTETDREPFACPKKIPTNPQRIFT